MRGDRDGNQWKRGTEESETRPISPMFSQPGSTESVPRWKLAQEEMLPDTAYQLVHDEMFLDGNARQNLATFVSTWMEPQADKLYAETYDKNMIEKDEYPQTAAIEQRCVRILADLWNSPHPQVTHGTSTVGSSEACMLGGLAMKRLWQQKRRAEGKPTDKPNIVFSSAVQVVWEKFANYWDVEPRYVPLTSEAPWLTGEGVLKVVDENTIAVVPVLGVTYTGSFEPVKEIAAALDKYQAETGIDIPIHVDAASGGFIAPFVGPDLEWDFRVERVHSINTSGHKFGLVYPGLGWVVWAKREYLPDDLIFYVSYLGGDMPTFGLNFSRPGAQVLLQYYNFLRLGRDGYTRIQKTSLDIGRHMAKEIGGMAPFDIYTDGTDMPMITWTLKEGYTDKWDLYDLADRLRERGWLLPAYPMPADMEDVSVMRVVFRNGVSTDLVSLLLGDIRDSVEYLDALASPLPKEGKKSSYTH